MSADTPRRPAAFALPKEHQRGAPSALAKPAERESQRKPYGHAAAPLPVMLEESPDIFNELEALPITAPIIPAKRIWTMKRVFVTASGLLFTIAAGLWVDSLIARLFSRADWLGWSGIVIAATALLAFSVIAVREWIALRRLDLVSVTRSDAALAYENNDEAKARVIIDKLDHFLKSKPETASGRQVLNETKGEIVDGRDLIRLAETELLAPLDRRAKTLIANAAKRVSVVTAVSPRALVDVGYILFESFRLIRQLSELYGSRPAALGLLRLGKNVVAHLAVTGSVAVGDSLIQQLLGHGIAAKLSARLGEGVINGLMTARVGIAAMDIVRPLPFKAQKRPGIGDFIGELTNLTSADGRE